MVLRLENTQWIQSPSYGLLWAMSGCNNYPVVNVISTEVILTNKALSRTSGDASTVGALEQGFASGPSTTLHYH